MTFVEYTQNLDGVQKSGINPLDYSQEKRKMKKPLSEISTIRSGHPIRGRITDDLDGDTCVVRMNNVSLEQGLSCKDLVRMKLPGRKEPQYLQEGDILFTARGRKHFAVCMSKDDIAHMEPSVAAPQFFVIRIGHRPKLRFDKKGNIQVDNRRIVFDSDGEPVVNQPRVRPQYLTWFINSRLGQLYFESRAEGVAVQHITRSVLNDLSVPLPSLAIQDEIVEMRQLWHEERRLSQKILEKKQIFLENLWLDMATNATTRD